MTLVNHVGVTVPDIDAAFAWYRDVLGLYPHVPPMDLADDGSHFGNLVSNLFGPDLHAMRIAHLTAADGLGVELFQFTSPATEVPDRTFACWRSGIFHFCLTVEDVTATAVWANHEPPATDRTG
jgi:catechol 2,3-dioxygenase-like lactoylglutathione lyase family enzyme